MPDQPITPAAIEAAYALTRPHVRETPILEAAAADFGLAGQPITFKLEFLQVSGTFKARGAFNNLLTRGEAGQGVVAASGGNHGVAVAYAAQHLGRKARIFVPSISSQAKIDKIKACGAEIVVGGANYAEALAASEEWIAQSGDMPVHAYDMPETIIGQGTVALELARQAPEVDSMLVSVGGGGLVGGVAAWYRGGAKVIGVEPERAPTLRRALDAGQPVDVDVSGLAADSLGARRLGSNVFPIVRDYLADALLVSDEEIAAAQRTLWDVLRIVAEPGGAAAFAALLSGRYLPAKGERVAVILCGANTTAVHFDEPAA
ncbi:MAG TPA: threonine/serine dehydratase [Devosia sp.]|nr:threonine/serine dehydratase [Devosia sp.]